MFLQLPHPKSDAKRLTVGRFLIPYVARYTIWREYNEYIQGGHLVGNFAEMLIVEWEY